MTARRFRGIGRTRPHPSRARSSGSTSATGTSSAASEETLATIGQATREEVDRAVGAARSAFADGWSSLPGSERAKYLFRIARILQERSRELAVLESLNGGKPIRESRDVDLPLSA